MEGELFNRGRALHGRNGLSLEGREGSLSLEDRLSLEGGPFNGGRAFHWRVGPSMKGGSSIGFSQIR